MTEPVDVVRRFLVHLEQGRAEAAVLLLDDDVAWKNTGLPTVRGHRVAGVLRDMERRGVGFEARVHHIAADGDTVLTDRTDVLRYKRWCSEFHVSGTFEVRDGQIAVWDDHYSPGAFVGASVAGLIRAVARP